MKGPAVLFDLDGTLADTAPDLAAALNAVLVERGETPLPLATLRPHTSNGARGLLGVGLGITPQDEIFGELVLRFLHHYETNVCVHSTLFPGVPALLDYLEEQQIPWGVVTNKHHRFTVPVLKGLGLHDRCACIVSGDTAARPKPDPAPILLGCEQAGVRPEQVFYVGDDERDILAGRAAGARTVAVSWGYLGVDVPLENWGADAIIHAPMALVDLLVQWSSTGTPGQARAPGDALRKE